MSYPDIFRQSLKLEDLDKCISSKDHVLRTKVASSEFATESMLMKLAWDEKLMVRSAVVLNPNSTGQVLKAVITSFKEDLHKEPYNVWIISLLELFFSSPNFTADVICHMYNEIPESRRLLKTKYPGTDFDHSLEMIKLAEKFNK